MIRRSIPSLLVILAFVSLGLFIPSAGFGGAETPCGNVFNLPPYFGKIFVEWVPNCEAGSGCVLAYGALTTRERGVKGIFISKREAIVVLQGVDQVTFLSLDPENLLFNKFGLTVTYGGKCFGISSAGDLDYKSATLFTADVVVMELTGP